MIRSVLVRALVVVPLLFAGCAAPDEPAPVTAGPSIPSDPYAALACRYLQDAMAEPEANPASSKNMTAGGRAIRSADGPLQDAGRRLVLAAKEVGELAVYQPDADRGPAELRLAEAQQRMHTVCAELFGDPPWKFGTPSP